MRVEAIPEFVFNGDVFNLSTDSPLRDPADSVAELLRRHPELRSSWKEQLAAGRRITLVAGNHDAAIVRPEVKSAILASLDLVDEAPLSISPWFVRRGKVHIEHGHLYDPDNAPAHPLAHWHHTTEPLGVALTRRFISPVGAIQFAHAHDTTPIAGLKRAFKVFGLRAPVLVFRYFATAIELCAMAGNRAAFEFERQLGTQALASFARDVGICESILDELVRLRPNPTHERLLSTFMRLYFDRVIATLTLTASAVAMFTGPRQLGALGALASGAYLFTNVARSGNRYEGLPEQRLQDAAGCISEKTGAKLVIFGHTHREDQAPGYLNTGSFAYFAGNGRPYLRIGAGGLVEQRRF
jgi:predicted phosphodiesterase